MFWTGIASSPASRKVSHNRLRIEVADRRATISGKPIELSPLLWRLLLLLAQRPDRLVTRSEIKRALWPYAERIDTERRLNTAVRALRAALGDNAESPFYIKTVRSYGYLWVAGGQPRGRIGLALACKSACLAVAISAALIIPSLRPIDNGDNLAAVMRVQSAVEEWRGNPTPAALARAERLVADATSQMEATPTLLVLKAELELGGHWDWRSAERAYRAALSLEPGNADARLGLAWLKVNRGERTEALHMAKQLMAETVLTGERRTELGWLLIRAARPALASIACGTNAPASINRMSCAHTALAALGRVGEARSVALQLMVRLRAAPERIERIRALPVAAGYAEFLDWRVASFLPGQAPWFQRAQLLADAGRHQEALDNLARAVAMHEPLAVKIASTPSFVPLSREPRFRMLAQVVGVPPETQSWHLTNAAARLVGRTASHATPSHGELKRGPVRLRAIAAA